MPGWMYKLFLSAIGLVDNQGRFGDRKQAWLLQTMPPAGKLFQAKSVKISNITIFPTNPTCS
jgi:hypothetical protein